VLHLLVCVLVAYVCAPCFVGTTLVMCCLSDSGFLYDIVVSGFCDDCLVGLVFWYGISCCLDIALPFVPCCLTCSGKFDFLLIVRTLLC
jgi:hypothetical protein